jgi:superfamily II DNA or RNA helicase
VHFDPLLPVARWAAARRLSTITDVEQVPVDMWREYMSRVPSGGAPRALGDMALKALTGLPEGEVPDNVPVVRRAGWDLAPTQDVVVATTDDEVRALQEQDLPFLLADDDAAALLIDAWGCQPAAAMLRVEWVADTPSEPVLLLDRFRRLRDYADDRLEAETLVSCSGLLRMVSTANGTDSRPQDFAVADHTIYYERNLPVELVLERVSAHYDLGLDAQSILRILTAAEDERVKAAMAACRAETELSGKLLALLPVVDLETALPAGLLRTVRDLSGDRGDEQVAELLVLVHGYSVLAELKYQLQAAGYDVPKTWAGSSPAIAFVQSLAFPTEYAGERGGQLAPDITVLGPPNLQPLHGYQKELAERIRALARGDSPGMRALLFLPTGAGKTRVTVQALVESLVANEVAGPVLWIAQTEELCEQAVQTWSTVWREFGDRPLRLCRLWGDNHVGASDADASVIVATDAKLGSIREREEYEWLLDTAIVVVDEAHGATGAGITAVLRWLGIEGRKTARPFLGLTATPFKGRGEEANKRLATRFGSNILNALGEDPYGELQRLGVLARVEHQVLPGSAFSLDMSERENFERYHDVPNSVLERIGRDQVRTVRLLDHIADQPSDWPILVFTSSVLAAQTLSALLGVRGIRSGTVSGSTPIKERRRTIEAFRSRDIQVLTNCNVLTEGFDAPGVRALYIARPTFSPNAYVQMVGRGLRGPANGGKDECLIVNIADTFGAFGETLAYQEFDYLWRFQGGGES